MSRNLEPFSLRNLRLEPGVSRLVRAVIDAGGRPLLVGGMVRDRILGVDSTDVDIEVHEMPLACLEAVLARFGAVDLVGKQFGVLRVRGVDADWSVPRHDSKGRHPEVAPDPYMGIEAAARRRDLTVNALAVDLKEERLVDPFGGLEDLARGVLRYVDPDRFVEDPLRFFRVMRFAGQLEMEPDPALTELCRTMELSGVAKERVEEEFGRLFLASRRPSRGLRWLAQTGRLAEVLPEAARLVGLAQDPGWHPEGDVWVHTLQVVDAAAALRIGRREEDLMLLWGALCHDLGKVDTTRRVDGRIRSPEHTERGRASAERLLSRIVTARRVIAGAVKLAVHHLKPHDFYVNRASPRAFRRLALELAPEANLELLARLALADHRGRNPAGAEPLAVGSEKCDWFLEQAEALRVRREPEKPVLMGRHLLDVMPPGPAMGRVLARAYEIQLAEGIRDVEILKARVLKEGIGDPKDEA